MQLAATALVLILLSAGTTPVFAGDGASRRGVAGRVYLDRNRNLQPDPNEPGVPGACVSNGREVRRTGQNGTFRLPRSAGGCIFVIKPSGYRLPVDENNVPIMSSSLAEEGRKQGGSGQGGSGERIALALWPGDRAESFRVLAVGDPQAGNHRELRYFRDGVLSGLADVEARFAVSLGDNVDDALSLYPRYARLMSVLGVPVHNVPGNHDLNREAEGDEASLETFKRFFGPAFYAFNHGRVHFVVLDDVHWEGDGYRAELGARQLEWLRNDLEHVGRDRLVVLFLHMPVVSWIDRDSPRQLLADRQRLYEILRGRRVLAVSGHTHTLERLAAGQEHEGWGGALPFPQLVAGAACGSWWSGPRDEAGVPFSYQREGAPKGTVLLAFNGTDYSGRYLPAGKPASRQMHVSFVGRLPQPGTVPRKELGKVRAAVNVFLGGSDTRVSYRIDSGPERTMRRDFRTPDPFARRVARGVKAWIRPGTSSHLWTAPLPEDLTPGVHTLTVRARSVFGHSYRTRRIFEVRGGPEQ
jgi:hypothetical protein